MRKLLFAAVATVAGLALLEAGLRVAEVAAPGWFPASPHRYFVPSEKEGGRVLCTDPAWLNVDGRGPGMWPQCFPAEKPTGAFRLFVLGGSFMGGFLYWRLAEDLAGWADARNSSFEVINAAGNGHHSTRDLDVLREVVRYQPDLVLIGTGNNELISPETAAPRGLAALSRRSHLFRALRRLALGFRLRGGREETILLFNAEGEIVTTRLIVDRCIYADPPQHEHARRLLAANLRAMAEMAARAGVPLALATLPINERFPPYFFSYPGFSPERVGMALADYQQRVLDAYAALQRDDFAAALDGFRAAYREYRDEATESYLSAIEAEAAGDLPRARGQYAHVLEVERTVTRSRETFNDLIRRTCADHGAALVDLDAAFRAQAERDGRAFDDHLFIDNCHPTPRGNRLAAWVVLQHLLAIGVLRALPGAAAPGDKEMAP